MRNQEMHKFIMKPYYFIKTLLILWPLFLFQGCLGSIDTNQKFDGGSGTENNPYRVSHVLQLQLIAEEMYLDKHFIQVSDIDASLSAEFQNGSGFKHIGDRDRPFTGSYNGNGYVIRDLHLHFQRSGDQLNGLFGYAKNARLVNITVDNSGQLTQKSPDKWSDFSESSLENLQAENVQLQNIDLPDTRGIGGLAGFNDGGIIRNCHFIGHVFAFMGQSAAGLVGVNTGLIENSSFEGTGFSAGGSGLVVINTGTIINSHASGRFSGMFTYGLVSVNYGEIISSSVNARVNGTNGSAGFAGSNLGGRIEFSFAKGEVRGTRRSAGLVLFNEGEIINSYSKAEVNVNFVTGSDDMEVNGLVLENRANGLISHSYAARPLMITGGPGKITGLAGRNDGTITTSYWDAEVSGQGQGVGEGNPDGATGLTTQQMTGPAAQTHMPEFDWQTVWRTTDGYPVLRWQGGE